MFEESFEYKNELNFRIEIIFHFYLIIDEWKNDEYNEDYIVQEELNMIVSYRIYVKRDLMREDCFLMNVFDMEEMEILVDNDIPIDQCIEVNKEKDLMIEVNVKN